MFHLRAKTYIPVSLVLFVVTVGAQVYHPLTLGLPPSDSLTAFKVGNGVTAPVLQQFISPIPTKEGLDAHVRGTVTLWCIVAPDGVCRDIKIARSLGLGLDLAAVSAVREWKFKPGEKDGHPVPVAIFLGVSFDLVRGITGGTFNCYKKAPGQGTVCA